MVNIENYGKCQNKLYCYKQIQNKELNGKDDG